MSKGIAIRTILLILVGTIVAGVLIYLVYSFSTNPTLSRTECIPIVTDWCTRCMISDWDVDVLTTDRIKECGAGIH